MADEARTHDRKEAVDENSFDVRLPMVAVTIIGALLRLYELGRESFWRDEGTAYLVANLPWKELWRVLVFERANMVFYFLLLRFWSLVVSGEWALRLLSVIPGVLSILLIYYLAARMFDKPTGFYSALFLSLSALHIRYSQELRGYGLMLALLILSLIFLDRAVKGNRPRDWAGHLAAAAIAFYCSTTAALLLIPIWITFPFVHRGRLKSLTVVVVSYLLATAPLLWVSMHSDLSILGTEESVGVWRLAAMVFPLTSGRLILALYLPLGAVVLHSIIRSSIHRRSVIAVSIWLVGPVGAMIAMWSILPSTPRYVVSTLIPLSLLVGFGLARIPRGWPTTLVVLAFVLLSVRVIPHSAYPRKPAWRDATSFVVERIRQDDGVAVYATQGSHSFLYYARDIAHQIQFILPQDPAWWTLEMPPDTDEVLARAKGRSRVWLILCAQTDDYRRRNARELDEALSADFQMVERRQFRKVEVRLYEHR